MGMGTVAKRSSSKSQHHRASHPQQQRPHSSVGGHNASISISSSSPGSARETFLTYFFGQNGPGPIAGSSIDRSGMGISGDAGHIMPVGRDVSGAEASISSGLMAGKRGIDGSNAAYDMKSLGKHIEAVSSSFISRNNYDNRVSLSHLLNA